MLCRKGTIIFLNNLTCSMLDISRLPFLPVLSSAYESSRAQDRRWNFCVVIYKKQIDKMLTFQTLNRMLAKLDGDTAKLVSPSFKLVKLISNICPSLVTVYKPWVSFRTVTSLASGLASSKDPKSPWHSLCTDFIFGRQF